MPTKPKNRTPATKQGLTSGVRAIILVLTLLAAGLAGYLAWISFSGRDVVGCGPDSGCAAVLNSRWAYWLGLPVSLFGGASYLALFAGTLFLGGKTPAPRQRHIWLGLLVVSWLVIGAAIWFVLLQTFILRHFCPFCMSAHAAAVIAAILLLRHCPYGPEPAKAHERERSVYVPLNSVRQLFLPAAAGLALLAAGQLFAPKKSYVEESLSGGVQITTNAAPATNIAAAIPPAESTNVAPEEPPPVPEPPPGDAGFRSIALFDGKLEFDLVDVPIIGRADAPHFIIGLHDYTCSGCRGMHKPLMDLYRKYSNDLAIVSLPLPLDSDCNPIVPRTPPAHSNACQYARISLAVWRADPDLLMAFDDWVFEPERPPSIEATRQYARQLVGDQAFAEAWNDPLVDRQLKINIALYGLNYQINKRSSMPQMFIGNSVLFGSLPFKDLEEKVVKEFGLKAVP